MNRMDLPSGIRIEQFDPQAASDDLWERYFEHEEALFKELNPEDPLPSRELRRRTIQDPGPFRRYCRWVAVAEAQEKIVGSAVLVLETEQSPSFSSNQHVAHGEIGIHPDYRRQGIGTAFLKLLVAEAERNRRTVLQTWTAHASGNRFCQKWGGTVAIEGAENRLKLAEVGWDMLDIWRREGPKRAPGVRVERFEDVPDADIEEYAALYTEILNQMPLGEMEDRPRVTPNSRRIDEGRMKDKGYTWVTLISREPDGAISGLTETVYNPQEPHKTEQWLTGVKEEYRSRGLGKWLKAEMAFYIREHYPGARFIVTGNATTNAPMLSINRRMGFKEHLSGTGFKFQANDLAQRLGL